NFILFYLIMITMPAVAVAQQTQTIRGVVVDEDTQQPVAGVAVWVDSMQGGAFTTDSSGTFVLTRVPVGKKYLYMRHIAYKPVERYEVALLSGKEATVAIALKEHVRTLDEVVVAYSEEKQKEGVRIVPTAVNRYAGNVRDPLRMLSSVVGVQNLSDDKNDLVVRGNSPIGVLWALEGCEILNPNHFSASGGTGGAISVFNPDMMGVSTLYTGAFPAKFGNVLSAVFDAKLRSGSKHKFEHYAQLSNIDGNAGSEGYLTKGAASYNLAYRQSLAGAIENVSQSYRDKLGATPDFKDFAAKLHFSHRRGATSVWAVGGLSQIDVEAGNGVNSTTLDIGNSTKTLSAGVGELLFLSDRLSLSANLYTSQLSAKNVKQDHDYTGQGGLPSTIFTDAERRYGLNATLTAKVNARNILTAGLSGSVMSSDVVNDERQFPEDTLFYYALKKQYGTLNAFAAWQHRFGAGWESTLGVHCFYLLLNGSWSVEPRASLSWQPTKSHSVTLYAGMYSRQNPVGLYLTQEHAQGGGFTQPYLSFGLMKSAQVVVSYRATPLPQWSVEVNGYYQRHYNVAVSQYSRSYSALNLAYYFDDIYLLYQKLEPTGVGQCYGVEVSSRFGEWKGCYAQLNGSLFSAKARGYDRQWYNTAFNNTYALTALAGKEVPLSSVRKYTLTVDISVTLAGGRRYTPLDVEASARQMKVIYDDAQLNAKQYAPYSRVDAKVGLLYNAKAMTHVISLDFRNVFDAKNIYEQLSLPLSGEVFTYTVYQLRFFPVVSYKILFST
ncbi:MAG: TonB-dependent receptor, partial [Prevotellaceae bacterium]|nr:TonB-dependent receptor [Prevotellaceae bacterium]